MTRTTRLTRGEPLRPRCMGDMPAFDWEDWCQATDLTIPLEQLFAMAPRARVGLANAIKSNHKKVRFPERNAQEANTVTYEDPLTEGTLHPLVNDFEPKLTLSRTLAFPNLQLRAFKPATFLCSPIEFSCTRWPGHGGVREQGLATSSSHVAKDGPLMTF